MAARILDGSGIDDRYRILRQIGAGGMGRIFLAEQTSIGRNVALKLLHAEHRRPSSAEALVSEARAISRLTSPHTITLHDVGQLADGTPYFAMEYLIGQTLNQRLRQGTVPLAEAVRILDSISLSITEAHARGIVHRDLKPANVFLVDTPGHLPHVKVIDFGLALFDDTTYEQGRVMGTPPYIAPECYAGSEPDARADIYALGVIAFDLFTGRQPFEGYDATALRQVVLTQPAPAVDEFRQDVPQGLVALVAACLAMAPALRPADGTAFRKRLREAAGLSSEVPPEGTHPPVVDTPQTTISATGLGLTASQSAGSRRQWLTGALAGVGVAGAAAFAWFARPWETASSRPAENTPDPMPSDRVALTDRPEHVDDEADSDAQLPTAPPVEPPELPAAYRDYQIDGVTAETVCQRLADLGWTLKMPHELTEGDYIGLSYSMFLLGGEREPPLSGQLAFYRFDTKHDPEAMGPALAATLHGRYGDGRLMYVVVAGDDELSRQLSAFVLRDE